MFVLRLSCLRTRRLHDDHTYLRYLVLNNTLPSFFSALYGLTDDTLLLCILNPFEGGPENHKNPKIKFGKKKMEEKKKMLRKVKVDCRNMVIQNIRAQTHTDG